MTLQSLSAKVVAFPSRIARTRSIGERGRTGHIHRVGAEVERPVGRRDDRRRVKDLGSLGDQLDGPAVGDRGQPWRCRVRGPRSGGPDDQEHRENRGVSHRIPPPSLARVNTPRGGYRPLSSSDPLRVCSESPRSGRYCRQPRASAPGPKVAPPVSCRIVSRSPAAIPGDATGVAAATGAIRLYEIGVSTPKADSQSRASASALFSRYQPMVRFRPASRLVGGFQPRTLSICETSSTLRSTPSALDVSQTISPRKPVRRATSSASSLIDVPMPVPMFRGSV